MKQEKEKRFHTYVWDMEKFNNYLSRLPHNYMENPEFNEAWEEFILYRGRIKAPLSEYGAYTNLIELCKIAGDDVDKAIASIRYTIGSGKWLALFEPKNYMKQTTENPY